MYSKLMSEISITIIFGHQDIFGQMDFFIVDKVTKVTLKKKMVLIESGADARALKMMEEKY